MAIAEFNVHLLKVSLDVPMKHRLGDSLGNLVVVTTPIEARIAGKSFHTSEGKRFPQESIMKVKILAEGMLPDYYVVCAPDDLDKAVELIHEALRKYLKTVLNYYSVVAEAAQRPLTVKTRKQFNQDLIAAKPVG